MEEKWEDVKGYEGIYQISTQGNVRSIILNKNLPIITRIGNHYVYLKKNGKLQFCLLKFLIASTFINNEFNYFDVSNIDGDYRNNKIDNLEWIPKVENKIEVNITPIQINEIISLYINGTMIKDLAISYNVNPKRIASIIKKNCKKEIIKSQKKAQHKRC